VKRGEGGGGSIHGSYLSKGFYGLIFTDKGGYRGQDVIEG